MAAAELDAIGTTGQAARLEPAAEALRHSTEATERRPGALGVRSGQFEESHE